MRKKKIDFKKYADLHEEEELIGKDGTKIQVRNHIPYADKVQMAKDVIENNVMIHDESCCYESYNLYAEKIKMMVKYYTNINVDDIGAEEVADFVINNDLIGQIREFIHDDYFEAEDVFISMLKAVEDTFTDDLSLKKAIRTSFGFLFNGEDITESIAKAEAARDTVYKAIEALNQKEKESEGKMDGGMLKIGDNILNFSRRE